MTTKNIRPNVADIVAAAHEQREGGWKNLDDLMKKTGQVQGAGSAVSDELWRTAQSYKKVFATAAGEQVLQHLMALTVATPIFGNEGPGVHSAESLVAHAAYRDGQNRLVFGILRMIEMADSPPPQKTSQT